MEDVTPVCSGFHGEHGNALGGACGHAVVLVAADERPMSDKLIFPADCRQKPFLRQI